MGTATDTDVPAARRTGWPRVRRWLAIGSGAILAAVAVAVLGFLGWLAMGDDARPADVAAARDRYAVTVTDTDGVLTIAPTGEASGVGVAFLPGARIERAAYVPTWAPIVEATGVTVYVPGVPLNLPLFGGDHVQQVLDAHPEVDTWVVGGHSMGGFQAAEHLLDGRGEDTVGLVLWASGTGRADLSGLELPTLAVAGGADRVVPLGMVRRDVPRLPADAELVVVDGMTHGQFGRYRDTDDPDRAPDEVTLDELVATTTAFLDGLTPT